MCTMAFPNNPLLTYFIGFVAGLLLAYFAPLSTIVTRHDYLPHQADSENGRLDTDLEQVSVSD